MAAIDSSTREWIRNASDKRAAANGCRFDFERGQFVVDWIQKYCRLYEGEWAGQPMILSDWQLECTLRLFGWIRFSKKWNRWIRRFRQASIWVAKKNKKSPTLAAWGLYLLAGDGEPGQKVFFAAKDAQQVRKNVALHVNAMIRQSPDLDEVCRINRTTCEVEYTPTRSYIMLLSSSDTRRQEAKEGINGSILVDECHVVDRELMDRVSRAGISRSEPLQIEVSTAGNNPDSYGYSRFKHAQTVERGEVEDQGLFAAVYAAPQDLAHEEIDRDPLRYATLANPALGHTVDPEELLGDYQGSKRSLHDLLTCLMYRFNIWQQSASPWLRQGDWEACRRDFAEADLAGRPCWAGLDLARTRDLCALVLCFPEKDGEEEYSQLAYFWLPEGRFNELVGQFPQMHEWRRLGWLQVTPGDVTDYQYIEAKVRELAGRFELRELAYDPRFAEELTQRLVEGGGAENDGSEGGGYLPGLHLERIAFAQSDANYAAPTEDYERLVIAGRLCHNGNPVLSWQIGHAQIKKTPSGVKRVVKPGKDDPRTVDGIHAGIMALARAQQAGGAPEPGITVLSPPGGDRRVLHFDDDEEGW